MIGRRWLSLLALCACSLGHATAAEWKAGVAKVVITPEKPMWMSGYAARTTPAEGKLHDLWAKALVLEAPGGKRCVLVTMDLVGIERALSVEVCEELKKKHGLTREAVMLSVSHTHCGPVVRSNLNVMYQLEMEQQQYIADYAESLKKKLVEVVGAAIKDLAPAKLSRANGEATFAVNRRTNKEADVPKLMEEDKLLGPVDHQVPVLLVSGVAEGPEAPKKPPRAIVFGYACHATVLSFYQWCGDYPGFAQIELEKKYSGTVAMFWAGCGADQNPLPRRTVELAEKYGKELAGAVDAVLKKPMKSIEPEFAHAYTEIDLTFGDLPSRDALLKATESTNKYEATRAKMLLEELKAKGSLRGTYPYPVQAWRLGRDLTWVTLGGEVVVDYSLRLKKELGAETTWVAGYCNDVMAYIPSLRVLKEGGYEGGGAMVYYGLPAPWSPKVEEHIVATVHAQAKRVRR